MLNLICTLTGGWNLITDFTSFDELIAMYGLSQT